MGILGRWMQANDLGDVHDKAKCPQWEGESKGEYKEIGEGEGQENETRAEGRVRRVLKVLEEEGGADGWVERCMGLIKGSDSH